MKRGTVSHWRLGEKQVDIKPDGRPSSSLISKGVSLTHLLILGDVCVSMKPKDLRLGRDREALDVLQVVLVVPLCGREVNPRGGVPDDRGEERNGI